jgi:acetylornithine deacetylase
MAHGGTARNILAGECTVAWEFRGEPELPTDLALRRLEEWIAERALPALRRAAPAGSIETRRLVEVPGLRPEPGSEAEALAFRLTRTNSTIAVPFATEAGRFQQAGLPVAICGPGSIDQAHQPDEFIDLAQIEACMTFLRGLMRELSA